MERLALDGFWLLGAFAVVYLVGVFTAQWAKDKIKGVPSNLRAALKTTESSALAEMNKARDKVVADTANLLARGKAAAVAEVTKVAPALAPAPAPAPVAAASVAAAAPAAPAA